METLDGPQSMKVEEGTRSGTVVKLRGKGMTRPRGGRGDHLVTIFIEVPQKLDHEQKQLLKKLRDIGL